MPDTNLRQSPSDQYEYSRRNIYLGTGVTLERGSRLEENVVVGKSCHIHAGKLMGMYSDQTVDSALLAPINWNNRLIGTNLQE